MCDSVIAGTNTSVPGAFLLSGSPAPAVRVAELGIVRVSGRDAEEFLHGQFTNAVKGLGNKCVLAGYCTPKGRLLATMRIWKEDEDFMILLPKSVAPGFIKRIRMYVMRADVKFASAYEPCVIRAVVGNTEKLLAEAGLEMPAAGETFRKDGTIVIGLPPCAGIEGILSASDRVLVVSRSDESPFPAGSVSDDSALWWLSEIASGTATVWKESREIFVPQAVNFELTGGVVFNKGCYPGQEVVARVQHIGKSNRRAFIARARVPHAAIPGDTVWSDGREAGIVIESVRTSNETYLLFSGILAAEAHGFSLCESGSPLELLPLPYVIKNVLFD